MSAYRELERRVWELERQKDKAIAIDRGYPVGTSFPTGITDGFLFYRSDLDWLCYYDGTRWLTAHELVATTGLRTAPVAGTYVIEPLRQDYLPYFTRVCRLINTGATNNASNYWTITVLGVNATQGATSNIDIATTAAQSGSTWATSDTAPSVSSVPSNRAALDFSLVATLAPSNLASIVISVMYRLVVT